MNAKEMCVKNTQDTLESLKIQQKYAKTPCEIKTIEKLIEKFEKYLKQLNDEQIIQVTK
jgi:hypothetical protein